MQPQKITEFKDGPYISNNKYLVIDEPVNRKLDKF